MNRRATWLWITIAVLLLLAGFAHAETGIASYYGAGERLNRHTASGERFNPRALTAAHRSLAFNTCVQVTNLRNGRHVILRINDRGPHRRTHRVIDVTRAAAVILDFRRAGTARVRITILSRPGAKRATRKP